MNYNYFATRNRFNFQFYKNLIKTKKFLLANFNQNFVQCLIKIHMLVLQAQNEKKYKYSRGLQHLRIKTMINLC